MLKGQVHFVWTRNIVRYVFVWFVVLVNQFSYDGVDDALGTYRTRTRDGVEGNSSSEVYQGSANSL